MQKDENNYNVKEYVETLSPKSFEQICVEYLKQLKGDQYSIRGTSFIKDGGKDITGKPVNGVPYEIWAECKKHTRSIGLEDISKNVVLVMSYGVNELIFFSTSNITETAKTHISKVASKHDFSVGFYYGDKLYKALETLPIFSKKISVKNNEKINIETHLSKYKNPEMYEKNDIIKLTRDTIFYINIHIENNSCTNLCDVCINIPKCNSMLFNLNPYDNNFKLPSYCEKIVQIQVDVLNTRKKLYIPNFEISYKTNEYTEKQIVSIGCVDPTSLLYFPVVSKKTNDYLLKIVKNKIENPPDFACFDIRGISGVGKTRLISEINKIASFSNWNTIIYDGKINKGFTPIKDLLCQLMGLPYLSHKIDISPNDIKNILSFHNDNEEFSDIIYKFIYKDFYDKETLYYLKNIFAYFLTRPYLSTSNIIILDNFQDFYEIVIEFVQELINICDSIKTNLIVCTSVNIEDIPKENNDCINNFFDFLNACPSDTVFTYEIQPLEENEAKILFEHALTNINSKSDLLTTLITKCGTLPFDIIMQIKSFQDEQIIEWTKDNLWYIPDFEKFDILINQTPKGSLNLIKRRLRCLKNKFTNSNYSTLWEQFKKIIKYLMYFENSLPICFLQDVDIDEETIVYFTESLFFKFDEEKPLLKFYHDNFYRYFSKIKLYCYDVKIAKCIFQWLESNELDTEDEYDSVLLRCYIDATKYEKAKALAIKLINNHLNGRDYNSVISISKLLLNDKHFTLSKEDFLDISIACAESYKGRVNHKRGAEIYYDLYLKASELEITIPKEKENYFYKNAINSCINSDYLQFALEILNYFNSKPQNDSYFKFLIHDRSAVINLGLGNVYIAESEIQKAKIIANECKQPIWTSIYLSDMGYIAYRGFQDKSKSIDCFKKAYNIIKSNIPYPNRKAELLQQYAFAELLDNHLNTAKDAINESVLICNELKETYLKSKARNLKGIIELYLGNSTKALEIWNDNLELCQNINNHPSQIRTYSNIAAYYLTTMNYKKAIGYMNIAIELLKHSEFSHVHFKELIINYYRISLFNNDDDTLEFIRKSYTDSDLYSYFETLDNNGHDCEIGLLYYNGANFIF